MEKTSNIHPVFFRFESKFYYNTFTVDSDIFAEAVRTGDFSDRRNVDDYLMSGEYPDWLEFPVTYHQFDGKKLRDLLSWSHHPYLMSERVKQLLEDNHVTGWKAFPIRIYDKKGNIISGYHGLSIVGRGGFFSSEKEDGLWRYDLSQWDGSDMFRIARSSWVTKRVKELFEENKIDPAVFTPFSNSAILI